MAVLLLAACGDRGEAAFDSALASAAADPAVSFTRLGGAGTVHFVIVDTAGIDASSSLRTAAKTICGNEPTCTVHFWAREADAARRLPMSESQANALMASYVVDRDRRLDDFTCHPFGSGAERCANAR